MLELQSRRKAASVLTGENRMNNPVDRYLEAFAVFCRAETQVAKIGEMIRTVGDAMKERLPVFLSVAYGVPLTSDEFSDLDLDLKVDMDEWPTAYEIKEAFNNWREAWRRATRAWNEVPVDRRLGLVKLPDEIPNGIDRLYYTISDQE
jgi:hypothetical protein